MCSHSGACTSQGQGAYYSKSTAQKMNTTSSCEADLVEHMATQHNTTQYNAIQHNTAQHNTTQHSTTQHNTTQHNTTHYNTLQSDGTYITSVKASRRQFLDDVSTASLSFSSVLISFLSIRICFHKGFSSSVILSFLFFFASSSIDCVKAYLYYNYYEVKKYKNE